MIAVVGCGNPNRSDDGLGSRVIGELRARGVARDDVRLFDAGTDGAAVMFAARGCQALIIVDACHTGSTPGAVFEIPGSEIEQAYRPSLNLHDFRWDHALHAGRAIFREDFPVDITVLLVEAQTLDYGLHLSADVAAALVTVSDRIEGLIASTLDKGRPV
jgi:hydrogenase maturation protease